MARFRSPKPLDWYGLETLGYRKHMPLTGNWITDQLRIEFACFRISHPKSDGGLGRFGHFKQFVDLIWNNPEMPSTKRFIWNPWAERMLRKACECDELGVAGPTNAGKSDPFGLWGWGNYIADPTHTKVLVMSTSITGAKMRVWKTLKEYVAAMPGYPGKPLWSSNMIQGPEYGGKGYGESSGVVLLAGEKSKEKDALEKMIGIKAPATGDADESLASLRRRPEYRDIVDLLEPEVVDRLLPELVKLSTDRKGKLILIIDEATGVSEAILNAITGNMKPGNEGQLQVIMLGNPSLHWDTFGLFCTPKVGWDKVTVEDEEWETATGGTCIRFNGERNPRITEGNEKYHWFQTQETIDSVAKDGGGRRSPMYHRFVLGFWCPQGTDFGVYSQADMEQFGAMDKGTVWGFEKPQLISALDPSFTLGGDKPSCTFFLYGADNTGRQILERTECIAIPVDASKGAAPVPHQVARNWRDECLRRGVDPTNACFDSSGAPSFASIVSVEWSSLVHAFHTQGKASNRPVGFEKHPDGKPVLCSERFGNKATEVWYGALPYLRSGQIKGITTELTKEICSRKKDIRPGSQTGRTEKIESKRVYKSREGSSPDDADSFFLGVELVRKVHRFRPSETAGTAPAGSPAAEATWAAFRARARKITIKQNLQR